MRRSLQVQILVLYLVVIVNHLVELVLIAVRLLLQLRLVLLVEVLLPPRCIIVLRLNHLLQLSHLCIILELFCVPFVLVPLVICLQKFHRLVS